MGEDVRVGAAGVFEGVGQDRQVVEGAIVVDAAGDGRDGGVVPGEPGGVDGDGAGSQVPRWPTSTRISFPDLPSQSSQLPASAPSRPHLLVPRTRPREVELHRGLDPSGSAMQFSAAAMNVSRNPSLR